VGNRKTLRYSEQEGDPMMILLADPTMIRLDEAADPSRAEDDCPCCGGRRFVVAYTGEDRPCSRCNGNAFSRWFDERRPKPTVRAAEDHRSYTTRSDSIFLLGEMAAI
jgi:hypothetical protein